jgi:hypothetical protein
MKDHRAIDQRSLVLAQAVADRLLQQPELVVRARATVARWLMTCSPRVRPTLNEWDQVLTGSIGGVISLLTGTDERSRRLRQSNPFAGALPQEERLAILRRFESYDAASA